MPRSIWNGTVTFGLIGVPIKVSSASEDRVVHFHQVHAKDGARIKQHRICSKEGKEIPYSEVAKGYEVSEDEYVLLSKDEIAAAAGESSRQSRLRSSPARTRSIPSSTTARTTSGRATTVRRPTGYSTTRSPAAIASGW